MITTQALLVILGWLGTRDLLGVSALPGPSTGNVSGVPRFHRTLRSVTSNTNATSPIDTGSYDVSIPVGLRILELFQYEVPKNRDDHEEGSYLGTPMTPPISPPTTPPLRKKPVHPNPAQLDAPPATTTQPPPTFAEC
ncbi:hypothetical protein B0T09DRAFT_401160 [Sordaria sp. MPI-SDFR-AT-0083]|nr:hypothetical protein B0T09DRAFT_401160 [Sordaria sp. MPI-SDFR-AT-0083]